MIKNIQHHKIIISTLQKQYLQQVQYVPFCHHHLETDNHPLLPSQSHITCPPKYILLPIVLE